MNPGPQAQAVMLLTVSFGKLDASGPKQLSTNEWARFFDWLEKNNLDPSALLEGELHRLLSGWEDRSITGARLESLLERGRALGLALEKWERAGLWIVTRFDPDYPERLERKLGLESPPVLFGCGNKKLLAGHGIAVVGSRDADQNDIAFTEKFGAEAAKQGYSIVSGGARGVDQSAMLSALGSEGTAVGVMADSLIRAATSAKYRKYLRSNDLVLITPFNPESGFNVGNAMSRNRYIYCLAEAAVVVSSARNKGGTWNGAVEALKAQWVPLWIKKPTIDSNSGNPHLLQKGAKEFPDGPTSLACLINGSLAGATKDARRDRPLPTEELERLKASETPDPEIGLAEQHPQAISAEESTAGGDSDQVEEDFYALFLTRMRDITSEAPMKTKDIAFRLDLHKSQADAWLKRGVQDGKIRKMTRPVRYQSTQSTKDVQEQPCLFGGHG